MKRELTDNARELAENLFSRRARPNAWFVHGEADARELLNPLRLNELRELAFGPVVLRAELYTVPPNGGWHEYPFSDGYQWTNPTLISELVAMLREFGFTPLQYSSGLHVRGNMATRHLSAASRWLAWALDQDIDGFYLENAEFGGELIIPPMDPTGPFLESWEVARRLQKAGLKIFHHSSRTPHCDRLPAGPPGLDAVEKAGVITLLEWWRWRPARVTLDSPEMEALYPIIGERLANEFNVPVDQVPFAYGRSWALQGPWANVADWTLRGESNIPWLVHPLDYRWQQFVSNVQTSTAIGMHTPHPKSPLYGQPDAWYPMLPFHLCAARASSGRGLDVFNRYYWPSFLKARSLWSRGEFELAETIRPRMPAGILAVTGNETSRVIKLEDGQAIPRVCEPTAVAKVLCAKAAAVCGAAAKPTRPATPAEMRVAAQSTEK